MPEQYRDLLDQDFYPLGAAVSAWRRLAEACEEARDTSLARVSAPLVQAGWEGEAARAGLRAMEVTQSILTTAYRDVLLIAAVMDHVRATMQAAQQRLRNAVVDAEAAGYRVSESGWVEPKATFAAYDDVPPADAALREANELGGFRARIAAAIEEAKEASGAGWRALRELDWFTLDKEYGAQSAQESAERIAEAHGIGVAAQDIPADASPERAARWWSGLSDMDQDLLLASYPAEIGALDGLPAETRDQANRAALQAQLDEYRMNERSLGIQDEIIFTGLTQLDAALAERANAPEHERLYLLGFDTEQEGRAIVSQGNPDTAANTAVLVPGTGTALGQMGGQIERIGIMQEAALDRDRGDVAVISWLGYDAPELSDSVLTRERADEGAEDLRDFTSGLRAAHDGTDGHLTVVGHSYGSTTVGAADAGGDGLAADDIVVLGSPGLTVDRAEDLHISPDRLWVGAAADDLVANHLSGLTLGAAPQDEGFGAREMYVDTSGHSGYWDANSRSLENMGAIIAGVDPLNGAMGQ
ncbi:alpha/beta hydrolase [Streptomyces sp. SBT349]|uniref:alpha/beta hydrolase n=1 Tax=Streptomyces sp. SBT349 TaxID=1580539 RepID=UPI00066A2AB4|nr:alpha/beta hydrolase [Streptomyces sp. SBT349]